MKPVALLVNDLHIGKDNILEFEKNWNEMLAVCEKHQIKKVFVGGDVFTTRNAQTLAPMLAVKHCFKKAWNNGIELHIAEGNHDKPVYDEESGWCDLYDGIYNVAVHDTYCVFDFESVQFAMVSYYPEETTLPEVLDNLDGHLKKQGYKLSDVILYLHAGVHGALGDFDVPNELPIERLKCYQKVLCGHYHNRTKIAKSNVEYIGSSRAHTFGEDEEKGYTLLFPDGSTQFVKNEVNTRYVTVDVDVADVSKWKNTYDERYKVRLRVKCTAAEADTVDRESVIAAGASKIEFDTEKVQAIATEQTSLEERFDTKNIQQEYKAFCKEKDVDSAFGMEYLDKIR